MKVAISLGDINGVGLEIALKSHEKVREICEPVYFINDDLLHNGAKILGVKIPKNFNTQNIYKNFKITPAKVSKKSGEFSFLSFKNAVISTMYGKTDGVVTLPINKEAWAKAGVKYVGHTEFLSKFFKKDAIMMLGCNELFVALFSDHVALSKVSKMIQTKKLAKFLTTLYQNTGFERVGVLGFNPHASDNGVIGGSEEKKIKKAINRANLEISKEVFFGPIVPDTAFTKNSLKNCDKIVAMYHDQGLTPLKSLYFDKSINVSLNLPIIRTSVDHGTAYDIAYKGIADISSYIEAVKWAKKFYEIRGSKGL